MAELRERAAEFQISSQAYTMPRHACRVASFDLLMLSGNPTFLPPNANTHHLSFLSHLTAQSRRILSANCPQISTQVEQDHGGQKFGLALRFWVLQPPALVMKTSLQQGQSAWWFCYAVFGSKDRRPGSGDVYISDVWGMGDVTR